MICGSRAEFALKCEYSTNEAILYVFMMQSRRCIPEDASQCEFWHMNCVVLPVGTLPPVFGEVLDKI